VKEHGVEFIQGLLLAFACMVILMPPFLRLLRWLGMGKQIREDGPGTHLVKQGTPTMGGVLIVVVTLVLAAVFDAFRRLDLLAALRARPGRRPRRDRRLPERQNRHRDPRPPQDPVAADRGDR
jgi:hypothetical protein